MKKLFYFGLFAGLFPLFFSIQAIEQQKQITMQTYKLLKDYPKEQDLIINNEVLRQGNGNCQIRYEVLKQILDQYKRPITVLDLGARHGYYSFRIAHDYPESTCVMIEGNSQEQNYGDQLETLCKLNTNLSNIILLKNKINLKDLTRLSDCEHFDVVLAFDFIEPKNKNWKKTINTILALGDNIFIQTSSEVKETKYDAILKKINEYLCTQKGTLIPQKPYTSDSKIQDKIYWFTGNKKGLRSKHFDQEPKDSFMERFKIDSTFDHKYLLKEGSSHLIQWKKGVNLVTFVMLNGAYPTKSHLKKEIIKACDQRLTDFTPWNILVQGNNIKLIDQNDAHWNVNVEKSLDFIFTVIDQTTKEGVINLFDNEYKKLRVRKRK